MEDVDAAATAMTGALIAGAVDGRPGRNAHGDTAQDMCLNCGTALVGSHCHRCGQAGHVHRTMGAIGHDIAHGVFHLEGRIWRTLPMLAFRPGELTRRYISGERARFVSPMALFLFSVFLMFAVVANLPGWHLGGEDWLKPGLSGGIAQAQSKLAEERAHADGEVAKFTTALAKERARVPPRAERIANLERRLAKVQGMRADLVRAEQLLSRPKISDIQDAHDARTENWFEQKIRYARENPRLLIYKLKTSAYKFSWALIPISLPFLWLLFPLRRDVGMYDHAVFATYSLTFMSLLVVIIALLNMTGLSGGIALIAGFIIAPLHMYRHLKGTYGLTRGGTLWRLAWLLFFAIIAIDLFIVLLLYLGLAD